MPVLSSDDQAFFDEQGYVIVRNAVPTEDLDALLRMIDRLMGLSPERWYKPPHHPGAFIEAYHQQELWNTRQRPRVVSAFTELFSTPRVLVGIDRASMKLPMHPDHPGYGGELGMHWDSHMTAEGCSPRQGLQGVLAITDTDEDMGGFACVPGSHKRVKEIVQRQSARFSGLYPTPEPDIMGKAIPMKAGDLLIWTVCLLHGSLENRSTKPRFAQYIKFGRAWETVPPDYYTKRAAELADFPPPGGWQPNPAVTQPYQWACRPDRAPVLTELGRKIAGLQPW